VKWGRQILATLSPPPGKSKVPDIEELLHLELEDNLLVFCICGNSPEKMRDLPQFGGQI
jgi:hypothetical protein